jgi:hypothetical protein
MATDPDDPNTPNGRISYKFLDDGLDAVAFNIGERVLVFICLKECFVLIYVGAQKCIIISYLNINENAVCLM